APGRVGQDAGAADRVGGGDDRRAAAFQPAAVDLPLGRVVVPPAGVVEVVPGAQQPAGQVGGGGAFRLAGEEGVIPPQPGVAGGGQFQAAGAVEQLGKQVELGGHQRTVEDEGGLVVLHGGEVGVEAVEGPAQRILGQPDADEAGVPGIQAVPPAAGGVVADVLPPGVDRVDHVGTQHRLHELLAQLQPPAGGQGGRRGQRGGGRRPGSFEAGAAQGGQPAAAGGGRRGGVGAADRAVDHPGLAGGQRDGPLEDVGIVPPAVAPQGGGDMVVDGVA